MSRKVFNVIYENLVIQVLQAKTFESALTFKQNSAQKNPVIETAIAGSLSNKRVPNHTIDAGDVA